jgi:hypothetical protein
MSAATRAAAMKSYSEREIFSPRETHLFTEATRLVGKIDERDFDREPRCHEVARAVGRMLELQHQDGHYLYAQHTWLWIGPLTEDRMDMEIYPAILDVYAVGSMPQVQIFDTFPALKRIGVVYKPGAARTDVIEDVVDQLVLQMESNRAGRGSRCRVCGVGTFGSICGKCKGETPR